MATIDLTEDDSYPPAVFRDVELLNLLPGLAEAAENARSSDTYDRLIAAMDVAIKGAALAAGLKVVSTAPAPGEVVH